MANIFRNIPPSVVQTLEDSCWAAVLESWSHVDPRFNPQLHQNNLIRRFGEGDTGGITPVSKIPAIAMACDLSYLDYQSGDGFLGYLTRYLPTSHIFCSITVRQFMHSVLIHSLFDNRDMLGGVSVRYMDPNDGLHHGQSLEWFQQRAPLLVMRKR